MFNNNYLYLKEKRLVLLNTLNILKKLNLSSKLYLLKVFTKKSNYSGIEV